ncbi:RNA-binding protein 41-like [Elysia marginata]|uniref:RNA-binding protein 41-like n=1 Tax=Elysia marginata TaxID=1093978 RepID=A0AAV4J2Z3_9GAST|nr:RNA-binding protein 41-like [Elysia marginata]
MTSNPSKRATVEGKLPCGNPKRYGGRDVVSMSQTAGRGTKRKMPSSTNNVDDNTKTEAELHLQRLLEKQMKTNVTLTGHFSEHRSFSEATKHRPGVDELIGVHGYQEYKLASDLDTKIDYLRHCGLNDEEIAIKMGQDLGLKDKAEPTGYGPEPESQAKKMQEIEMKIKEKDRQLQMPHSTKGALLLTRQRMELEASHSQRFGTNEDSSNTGAALIIQALQHDGRPRISIKLLSGRMKGQAFVTLPDEAAASEALNLVNGYLLHDSPVIVSYGKKT